MGGGRWGGGDLRREDGHGEGGEGGAVGARRGRRSVYAAVADILKLWEVKCDRNRLRSSSGSGSSGGSKRKQSTPKAHSVPSHNRFPGSPFTLAQKKAKALKGPKGSSVAT